MRISAIIQYIDIVIIFSVILVSALTPKIEYRLSSITVVQYLSTILFYKFNYNFVCCNLFTHQPSLMPR